MVNFIQGSHVKEGSFLLTVLLTVHSIFLSVCVYFNLIDINIVHISNV